MSLYEVPQPDDGHPVYEELAFTIPKEIIEMMMNENALDNEDIYGSRNLIGVGKILFETADTVCAGFIVKEAGKDIERTKEFFLDSFGCKAEVDTSMEPGAIIWTEVSIYNAVDPRKDWPAQTEVRFNPYLR